VAEWLGRGLQSLVHRFNSGPRLCVCDMRAHNFIRALSSGGERFPDTEEVGGSNPPAPTKRVCLEFGQPAVQQATLGVVVDQVQRAAIRDASLFGSAETPQ
jgi:hypothetical protein